MKPLQPSFSSVASFTTPCSSWSDSTSNVIDRFVPLIGEDLESLNDLGAGLYGEFQRLDCLDVMTRLDNGAAIGGAERCRRDAERRVESSDKSKVG